MSSVSSAATKNAAFSWSQRLRLRPGPSARLADVAADRSSELIARDLKSVWHPFTQHALWPADEPLVIDRAAGVHLYDSDGRRYLDGVSSLWVTVHGHNVPEINAAITAQLGRLDHSTFLGLTHEPGIRLAEELLRVAPDGLSQGVLRRRRLVRGRGRDQDGLPGGDASAARTGRSTSTAPRAITATRWAPSRSAGWSCSTATYRPLLIETRMVGSPGVLAPGPAPCRSRRRGAGRDARACSAREGEQVCAVVVEPLVQAAGGMLTHDPSFLRGVRDAVRLIRRRDAGRRGGHRHRRDRHAGSRSSTPACSRI